MVKSRRLALELWFHEENERKISFLKTRENVPVLQFLAFDNLIWREKLSKHFWVKNLWNVIDDLTWSSEVPFWQQLFWRIFLQTKKKENINYLLSKQSVNWNQMINCKKKLETRYWQSKHFCLKSYKKLRKNWIEEELTMILNMVLLFF